MRTTFSILPETYSEHLVTVMIQKPVPYLGIILYGYYRK